MTLVPLTTCCLWLDVDRKTLRLWLSTSQFSCCLHPTDARLRCLTLSDLQQLALLHGRHLPVPLPDSPAHAEPASPTACSVSAGLHEVSVDSQLRLLRQQVTTLHAQVADLALAVLRLTQVCCLSCPAPSALAASRPIPTPSPPTAPGSTPTASAPAASEPIATASPPATSLGPLALAPSPARSQALALIQVRSDGSVVIISPTQGVLGLLPDSPEWFAWLASLTAFSFQDLHAHFSAARLRRHKQWTHGWNARRSLHGRACSVYLGLNPILTLAHLQEIAATIHTRLTSR